MIVCASRRTDIPAFHSEWFMNRLREGYCLVRNPVRNDVIRRIDLTAKNADMIVFMTKDPGPMVKHLDELSALCKNFCFQVTVTPYGKDIEPNIRSKKDVIRAFGAISERIGKERVIWRYDPVIFNDAMDEEYHREGFEYICGELGGYTKRCVFGFLDVYEKLETHIQSGLLRNITSDERMRIAKTFSSISGRSGIELTNCRSDSCVHQIGISGRACIDKEYMARMNVPYEIPDVPLRTGCGCVKNIDIGDYDTCMHGCVYCYANSPNGRRPLKRYDVNGELLFGTLRDNDKITEHPKRQTRRITEF